MKKTYILSTIAVVALLASTTSAAALSLGASVSGNASLSSDDSNATATSDTSATVSKNSNNERSMNANSNASVWKTWMYNDGIAGTVTATNGSLLTIKGTNGTVYSVNTADANIRYANGSNSVQTGDHVYVQGATNGTSVVATLIIDAKTGSAKPSNDDTRSAITGTVTAKNNDTLTIMGKNGTTYTVSGADATVWKTGHQRSSVSDISVGDAVVVQGSVSGSSVAANRIMAITFPNASGNGGIHGTVTAVNGNTVTMMVAGGTTYTVNTASAAFSDKKGKAEQQSDITVGDTIVVNGDVNGSTINATSVSEAKIHAGFFARIGGFFKHLFGKKTDTAQ